MKQFNLEEYLKNPTKKVITRDGRSAKIIYTDRKNLNYPIVALVENKLTEGESILCYTKEGKIYIDNGLSEADLFFATEKREGWINLYKMNSIISPGPRAYDTKEEAESAAGDKSYYISTIKIKWEE